jgi:cellulose synthase/poly-beta-1,6-N-acetylglucosamine synthase-like glycosyltransferase
MMKDMGVSLKNIFPQERENAVMDTVSVIIPISERHDDIEEVYQEYRHALVQTNIPVEMIFVVDGELDRVYQILKSLKNRGENLTIIKHSRRFQGVHGEDHHDASCLSAGGGNRTSETHRGVESLRYGRCPEMAPIRFLVESGADKDFPPDGSVPGRGGFQGHWM